MGFIYKEEVHYKKVSFLKGLAAIFLFIVTINLLINSNQYSINYNVDVLSLFIVDGLLIAVLCRVVYNLLYVRRISYTYKLIDRELIFEKVVGESKRVILGIDTKDIELFVPAVKAKASGEVVHTYKFLCCPLKSGAYSCVVNNKGKRIKFFFQPSAELIRKLNILMESNISLKMIS